MSRRGLVAALILVTWAAMVGWHVRREYFQPELARVVQGIGALGPATHFYAVRMGGELIGLATSRLDTLPEGFRLEERLNLELRALAQEGTAVATTSLDLGPALETRSFVFSLTSDAGVFEARGEVAGDSLLTVRVETGGGPQELSFRTAEAPLASSVLPLRLALGGDLEVGRVRRAAVFDPSTVSVRDVELEVLARDTLSLPDSAVRSEGDDRWRAAGHRPREAWQVAQRYGGVTVESWIDADGRVIRSSSPTGFTLERLPFELIEQERADVRTAAAQGRPRGDVILATAIAADADPTTLETSGELRFVLSGVDLDGFDLDGGRQTLVHDTLGVRREEWGALDPGYSLPYPRMDLREALQPEPLVQSGDPRIQRAARRAVRGVDRGDPVAVAARLAEAVHDMLEKEVSFSLPSALQVLETGAGDCNEHTVLYLAFARALGLPARSAVGLVHLDGSFFYHAWPEVWLGRWVAVDPTLGRVPAGAAHLRFTTGGLAQQVEIARLIGSLRIEVVPPTAASGGEG
ncbi:MAG: transglutaminase-like domain-containing protein [bacterium]